jgi:hypothetical protein
MGKTRKQHRGGRGGKRERRDASPDLSPTEQITQGIDRLANDFKRGVRRMVQSQIAGMGDQNAAVKTTARELLRALGNQFSIRTRRLAETSPFRKRPRS